MTLQAEIVRMKRRFPSFGLKKVRDFLKRFAGRSVSTGSVRKVLAAEGLHVPPPAPKKKKSPLVRRFERAKPGELWQTDITSYVLTRSRVRVYLTVFLDDFSRYVVSWQLATHQRSALVCEALMEGIERFGKPEEVLTDQGRQYFAWRGKCDFQRLLVREGIRHVVARTRCTPAPSRAEPLQIELDVGALEGALDETPGRSLAGALVKVTSLDAHASGPHSSGRRA